MGIWGCDAQKYWRFNVKVSLISLALLLAVLSGSSTADAAPPQTMNFQGYLKVEGRPLDHMAEISFVIYDNPITGKPLWSEVHRDVVVSKGQFSVVLGQSPYDPRPIDLPFDRQYWLGISVNADPEMTPRQPLTSAPYAFRAMMADSAASVASSAIPDGAITAVKLDTAYVKSAGDTMTGGLNLPANGLTVGGDQLVVAAGGNVGIGSTAPAEKLEVAGNLKVNGNLILPFTNPTSGMIMVGNTRMMHIQDDANFFAGINAGNTTANSNTYTFYGNTGIGGGVLSNITTGTYNTGSGWLSLSALATGTRNSAYGYQTLKSNKASYNTAIGSRALEDNTDGNYNVAVGDRALEDNTIGSNNTAIGAYAGYTFTPANANLSGSNNTFIGIRSGPGTTVQLENATAIGADALVSQSNSLVLGSTGVKVGIGTSTPTESLDVMGNIRTNNKDIILRGNGDIGHGLGWYGNGFGRQFKTTDFAEGPILYGYNHGALGTSSGNGAIALKWHSDGSINVTGLLTKASGSFKIDHPLEPRDKYLYHSFVESPDMMNIYNGNITTDAAGFATVELPAWFEALNREFRYQLTVIGQFAQAIVAKEIGNGKFTVQTDKPQVKVSWQVTGIRKDPYAEKNRIQVEEEKPASEKGSCLHAEACE